MPSFSLSRQQHFPNLAVHQNKIQGDADNLSFSLLVCVQYLHNTLIKVSQGKVLENNSGIKNNYVYVVE